MTYANNIGGGNIILNGGVIDDYANTSFTRNLGTGVGQIQITGGNSGFGTNGSATITLSAATWGSATFNPSALVLGTPGSSAGTTTYASAIDLNGADRTVLANSAVGAGAISGLISNGTGTAGLIKTGVGTLTLSNAANTYNGVTTISNGTLTVGTFANVNTNSSIGKGSVGGSAADLVINGGTLQYSGTTAASTNRLFTIGTSGASLNASGTTLGTLSFTSTGSIAFSSSTAPASLTLTGTGTTTTGGGSLASVIGDSGSGANITSLTKSSTGTWALSGTNTYTGVTTITGGALILNSANALPGGIANTGGTSNLTFNGGVLGLGTGDFTRDLNTAATPAAATFTGAGGWAAFGADRVVNLNNDVHQIAWATAGTGFNGQTLILSNASATHTVDLQNGITLGAATRTVQVDDGTALLDAKMSGVITGGAAGALTKTGAGVLSLSNANTYTGVTTISAGVLRLDNATALPGGIATAGGTSNLTFNGGVLGLANGDFTRSLNTAATTTAATFSGTAGGWAAYGADRVVNLGGASTPITWATANTGFNNLTLILGAASATHMVDLQNPLVVTTQRTVQVDNGSATYDGKLSGNISGTGGSIKKTGAGALWISGNMSQTGGFQIDTGTVMFSGTNTYSGNTNFNGSGTLLIFAGTQAVSPNSTYLMNLNVSTSDSAVKLLDDTGGVNNTLVTATGSTFTIQNNNSPGNGHTFTVGNNNTANGGTSSGTTTGSTIAIGTLNWNTYAAGTTAYGPIGILGTDGYRLQINSVVLHNAANNASGTVGQTTFVPTTANVTLGTVTVGTGNVNQGLQTFVMDGTSSDNRVTGIISNASDFGTSNRALSVTKSNTSTWTLSGANTYTGTTTITGGSLILANTAALGAAGQAVALNGGTLDLHTDTSVNAYNVTVGATSTIESDRATLGNGIVNTFGTLSMGAFTLNITENSGHNVNNDTNYGVTFGTTTLTGNAAFNVANNGTGIGTLTLGAIGESGGARTLTKQGAGKLAITGVSTYTGLTTVSAGTLALSGSGTLGTSAGGVTMAGGSLDLGGLSVSEAAGAISVTNAAASGDTISNGSLTGLSYAASNATGNAIISANLLVNASAGFAKSGAGTVTLTGTNTYTGGTTLSAGTLTLGNTAALGAAGQAVALNGGTLDLHTDTSVNAYNVTVGASVGIEVDRATSGNGIVNTLGTLSMGAFTLSVTANNFHNILTDTNYGVTFGATTLTGSPTFNVANNGTGIGTLSLGALADGGTARTITKIGAGNLVLGAAATTVTTGTNLVVNTGTVREDVTNALGASALANVTVNATTAGTTAAFNLNNVNQSILSLTFGGATATSTSTNNVATGTGTLTLGGGVTYTNTNNPLGSTISGNLGLGTAARTFSIADSTGAAIELDVQAAITNGVGGGITKTGAGLLLLSGNNSSYSGPTILQAGTTRVTQNTGLGTSAVTLNTAVSTLQLWNNGAGNNGVISYGNGLTVGFSGVTVDVNNNGANTGNTVELSTLNMGAAAYQLNVTGSNSYGLRFTGTTTFGIAGAVFNPTANLELAGATTGNFAWSKFAGSAGTLTLSGTADNVNTGLVTINSGGMLVLNKTSSSTRAIGAGGISVIGNTVQYAATAGNDQINDAAPVTLANGAGVATLNLNGISDRVLPLGKYHGAAI